METPAAPCPAAPDAEETIRGLQLELRERMQAGGCGPFLAAVCRADGTVVAKAANSVVQEQCSNCHAEMNAIRAAQQKLGTYDLAPFKLSLYSTAEPCMMCLGGILWSGLRAVYYGVPTADVERITGFDEGFKPDWHDEFEKRGICVQGGLAAELGADVLREYVALGHPVYKPERPDEDTLLYARCCRLVIAEQRADADFIQERLGLSYAKTLSYLCRMEEDGIVSAAERPSSPRAVLKDKL